MCERLPRRTALITMQLRVPEQRANFRHAGGEEGLQAEHAHWKCTQQAAQLGYCCCEKHEERG